jgi:hypothetical protein
MVSTDHFRYELISQLKRAAEQGATTTVITSRELCQSIRIGSRYSQACCEAMQAEIKPGDVVLNESDMAVCYRLPRPKP